MLFLQWLGDHDHGVLKACIIFSHRYIQQSTIIRSSYSHVAIDPIQPVTKNPKIMVE